MSNRFNASSAPAQPSSARRRPASAGKTAVASAARACIESLEGRTLLSSVIAPMADTFVRDHDYALTNFGASPLLIVKQAGSGDDRISYLKFDLTGVTSVSNAVLQLTGKMGNQLASPVSVGVFGVSDTSWIEGDGVVVNNNGDGYDTDNSPALEMTWNNQPTITTGALASVNVDRDTYQSYSWDVTSYLQQQLNAGKTQVTLALQDMAPSELITQFLSREANGPGPGPELIVTQNQAPAPPTATISSPDVTTSSTGETVSVTYSSSVGINASTIDPTDIQVAGPKGPLSVTGVTTSGSGNSITALYTVAAPSGSWTPTDNGPYTVTLQANAVQDTSGVSVGSAVGSFRVNVGDTTAPSAAIAAGDLTAAGGTNYSFNITYTDDVAVDVTSINVDNVRVTGPAGSPLHVSGVSVNPATNSGTVVATYTVAAPNGTWSAADNGAYTVKLNTRQVMDTAGNTAPGATAQFAVNIAVADATPPTASVSAPDVTTPGGLSEAVTVVYSDNVDVSAASIDPSDITVTGPGGGTLNVSGVTITPSTDAGSITAIYTVSAPTGGWAASANGTYTITVNAGQVTDTSGNGVGAATGSFSVRASTADNAPPSVAISAPTITKAGGGTQAITVVYHDNVAVDATSIDASDLSISGPSGPLTVTGVTFNPNTSAGTITATYTVAAPSNAWDATDDGAYTIALNANQVRDTSGNAAPVTFGSFTVNIPLPNPADPTFANGNIAQPAFNVQAVTTEPDGSIVVVGYQAGANGQTQAVIQRLTSDGSPDPTFGASGQVVTPAGSSDAWYAVTIQGANHFLVAGTHNGDFSVARFDFNGNLDPTFGNRGVMFTDFGASNDTAYAIAISPTAGGSIVLVGTSNKNFAFARYNANGQLDGTFGEGGRQVFDTGASVQALGAVAVQSDGRVVAAGASGSQIAVVRLTASGDPDTSFNGGGIVSINGLAAHADTTTPDYTEGLALQSDGKILVANRTSSGHFGVARLTSAGALDSSFGSGGIATANFGGDDDADSVVVQDSGDILAVGTSLQGSTTLTAVAAFTSNGQLNGSFGSSGKVTFASGVASTSRELHTGDLVLRAFGSSTSGGKLLVGAGSQGITTTTSSLRRLIVPGSKNTPSIKQTYLGAFGKVDGKKNRVVIHALDGTVITINMTGGSGNAMQVGDQIRLTITADPGAGVVLSITTKGGGGRASFSDIIVTGNIKSMSAKTSDISGTLSATGTIGNAVLGNVTGNITAGGSIGSITAGDLGGNLTSGGSIKTLKLHNVTGVIAAAGTIGNVTAASLSHAKVLAGANVGTDGVLGSSTTFAAAMINSLHVLGQITGSFIGAGVDPVDAIYGNTNDRSAGAASLIKSIVARGADTTSKFESHGFKNIKIGGKVNPATDPRFRVL